MNSFALARCKISCTHSKIGAAALRFNWPCWEPQLLCLEQGKLRWKTAAVSISTFGLGQLFFFFKLIKPKHLYSLFWQVVSITIEVFS